MIIEIVDEPAKIAAFLPTLDGLIPEGLVTLERLRVVIYRHNHPS